MATKSSSKPNDGRSGLQEQKSRSMDVSRTWIPKNGLLGYFAHDRYGLLPLVCLATATEGHIEQLSDENRIQLRSSTEWEVNEAMEKLNGLALVMAGSLGYRVEDYTAVNRLASQRVLLGATTPAGEVLGMQVPVAYRYNAEVRTWELLDQLCNPPCLDTAITNDPEMTQAWADFRFPAVGSNNGSTEALPLAFNLRQSVSVETGSKEHLYLRSSKADELTKWVQDAMPPSAGERTGPPSSTLASVDESVSELKSSTKEVTEPRRSRGIRKRMTRAAYEARHISLLAAQSSSSALVSGSPVSAPTSLEHIVTPTSSLGPPPAKTFDVASTPRSLPRQASTLELSTDGTVNKTNSKTIPASKSSLRATAAAFLSMRGKKPNRSLHASTSLRPTAAVFTPALHPGDQFEAFLTSPTLREPESRIMVLKDLAGAEEEEDIPVKITGTAYGKITCPVPGQGILIDFGSPTASPPGSTRRGTVEDQNVPIDLSCPVEADNVDESLVNTCPLEFTADGELIVHGRDIFDIESPLPALAAEERACRIHSTPDNLSWLEHLPGTFDRLKSGESEINLSPAQGTATYEFLSMSDFDAESQGEIMLDLPDYHIERKPSEAEDNFPLAVYSLKENLPILKLPNSPSRLDKGGKSKEREVESPGVPVLHQTMKQKAAPNPIKTDVMKPQAVTEASGNAVISKASGEASKRRYSSAQRCTPSLSFEPRAISKPSQMQQRLADSQKEQTKYLFNTIEPLLDAAKWYPGPLSLSINIGLLLLFHSPNLAKKEVMFLDDLKQHLNNSLGPSTCRFFDRLTTSPTDVDYIINLEVNDCHLFDEKPEEQTFQYEFDCNFGGEQFLVVIDQSHNISIAKSPVPIGSVHLNAPGSIWDASLTIYGSVGHFNADFTRAKEAAEEIARNMFVEPGRTHIRLVLRTPKDLNITKVTLQRTTIHRHIPPKGIDSCDTGPYMYLRAKETQDLIISANYLENIITAHSAPRKEMVKANRQWWSVSLISPILNATLHRNSMVEPGDKTTEWTTKCLFGDDAEHLWETEFSEPLPKVPVSSVGSDTFNEVTISSSIGCAGLASLVRLAETVVKNIDAVGANNAGPRMKVSSPINRHGDESNDMDKSTSREIAVTESKRDLVAEKQIRFW
ncbi:uncharacterized protein N7484_010510 [Penicillium longicatenatum]|uniref:uncharacterized protein n=1 Tax=Penicillium longicatenatum TaxID=1561947 RepID=UPI0025484C70|nr:uncharacterized protein N7484_010510 [Penicillium longicatenatum]KAJ5630410.1 hypothetical protein N7484_010510 [Penicillium longicatenatum]